MAQQPGDPHELTRINFFLSDPNAFAAWFEMWRKMVHHHLTPSDVCNENCDVAGLAELTLLEKEKWQTARRHGAMTVQLICDFFQAPKDGFSAYDGPEHAWAPADITNDESKDKLEELTYQMIFSTMPNPNMNLQNYQVTDLEAKIVGAIQGYWNAPQGNATMLKDRLNEMTQELRESYKPHKLSREEKRLQDHLTPGEQDLAAQCSLPNE